MHTGMYGIQAATSTAGTGYMQVEAGAVYINTPAWLPRKLGRQTCVADRQRENWGKVRRDKKRGGEKGARGKN